ncbi:MAG: ankyrin repeat domain-containing protein [Cyanobacteria bacterium J06626_18]
MRYQTDPNSVDINHGSLPALHRAAGWGNADRVRELLDEGANPNHLDPVMGNSPLHLAAQGGNVETASLLLDWGAFLNLQTPTHGVTPLMIAVWHRKVKLVAFLLSCPKLNIELRSTFGLTASNLASFGVAQTDAYAQQQSKDLIQLFDNYHKRRSELTQGQRIFSTLTSKTLSQQEKGTHIRALMVDDAPVNTVSPIMSSGNDGHTPLW